MTVRRAAPRADLLPDRCRGRAARLLRRRGRAAGDPQPPALAARGGVWFQVGAQELHCGVEQPFAPAAKAHPALAVTDVRAMAEAVERAGGRVSWDQNIPGVRRFHTLDPVGNRVEFQQV